MVQRSVRSSEIDTFYDCGTSAARCAIARANADLQPGLANGATRKDPVDVLGDAEGQVNGINDGSLQI